MSELDLSSLSEDMKRFFRRLAKDYDLQGHHLRVLLTACQAWDRCEQARALVAKEGLTVATAHGSRAHPAVGIERDSRVGFLRGLRELGLSDEALAEAPRPPALHGRYRGRS